MKILSSMQVYEADRVTIERQAISSTDLMERAGLMCYQWICDRFPDRTRKFHVYCGMGNNGGDGLVISRLLHEGGYKVAVYLVNFSEKRSKDFAINLLRLQKRAVDIIELNEAKDFLKISVQDLVVDCIFGIGLKRSPEGFVKRIIEKINGSGAFIIAVDVPSGLFSDEPVKDPKAVICADATLTFQVPKIALLLPDNQEFCGDWEVVDIQLDMDYIKNTASIYELTDTALIENMYKSRKRFSHKGSFGHSLLIGGSFGKIGAMVLASKAALRAGSGLVSTYIPKCGYVPMQSSNPEVMVEVDDENYLEFFNFKTSPSAIGIGPGMGTHLKTKKGFVDFYSNCKLPLVIDADALNIIAELKELGKLIPENTILTPHPKEFERLVGRWANDYQKLDKLRDFSKRYKCVVLLKGAYTAIAYKDKVWFNSSGNPALATAGSGDVLTGILTALLAQGYHCLEASLLGAYIHGRAADIAIELDESEESFIASDIIDHLGLVYKEFV